MANTGYPAEFTEMVAIRVSEKDVKILEKISKSFGLNRSEFIRLITRIGEDDPLTLKKFLKTYVY